MPEEYKIMETCVYHVPAATPEEAEAKFLAASNDERAKWLVDVTERSVA